MSGQTIARMVQMACIHEVCASKPGNVGRHYDFHDAVLEDYLISAAAIGSAFENVGSATAGQIIYDAVDATQRLVRTNTNLGLILLLAPLAKAAWLSHTTEDGIRQSLHKVLRNLSVDDARMAYKAIRLANPSGLGHVHEADIADDPQIPFLEIMNFAKQRDSIAYEYVSDYAITFDIGFPALRYALAKTGQWAPSIVHAYLFVLSRVPDTLIARKRGMEIAMNVSLKAQEIINRGSVFTPEGMREIEEMHRFLADEEHSLNPGTSADLTAAAIFLSIFESYPYSC